jgi:hypothetical protein
MALTLPVEAQHLPSSHPVDNSRIEGIRSDMYETGT